MDYTSNDIHVYGNTYIELHFTSYFQALINQMGSQFHNE